MSRHTTNDYGAEVNLDLIDRLVDEFVTQCRYVPNKGLLRDVRKNAVNAASVCNDMQVDPETYVRAQIMFSPVLKGYQALTPQQLCSKDSRIYVTQYIATETGDDSQESFAAQCNMFSNCLDNGWTEKLCLANPSFDFASWFRILLASTPDPEVITKYGSAARQVLLNNRNLLNYLKSIKSDTGQGLDFKRIPFFKYE